MKKIIFVDNLSAETKDDIASILDETRAIYSLDLQNKAVVLEGSNDVLHACKVALNQNGYKVN